MWRRAMVVALAVAAAVAGQQKQVRKAPPVRKTPVVQIPDTVEVKTAVVYTTYGERRLRLDLYLPKAGAGPFPAVVYIHGGGWREGNPPAFRRQAIHMPTKGFVGACIEYRLSGEARYPAAVHDPKAAVRWLLANAAQYRVQGNRIGAAGGSTGGHLAALLGTTHQIKALEGNGGHPAQSSRVQAVAVFNPALDLVELANKAAAAKLRWDPVSAFLGVSLSANPRLYGEASPITHVSPDAAPFLLAHGTEDRTVPYHQSVAMLNKLKQAGVRAELYTVRGADHGFFQGILWYEEALEKMEEFFTRTLK
jgi:acetyl esterase/lipase